MSGSALFDLLDMTTVRATELARGPWSRDALHGGPTSGLLARAVERCAEGLLRERHPGRELHANVEFYTAVLLDAIGLPRELFTPTFAVARVAGWLAHVKEQRTHGRLIRPAARYVGALPA